MIWRFGLIVGASLVLTGSPSGAEEICVKRVSDAEDATKQCIAEASLKIESKMENIYDAASVVAEALCFSELNEQALAWVACTGSDTDRTRQAFTEQGRRDSMIAIFTQRTGEN